MRVNIVALRALVVLACAGCVYIPLGRVPKVSVNNLAKTGPSPSPNAVPSPELDATASLDIKPGTVRKGGSEAIR